MQDGLTVAELRDRVEEMVIKAGSLRGLAKEWSVSPSCLSDFLNGRRGPGQQLLRPLGLVQSIAVRYIPGKTEGRRRRGVRET